MAESLVLSQTTDNEMHWVKREEKGTQCFGVYRIKNTLNIPDDGVRNTVRQLLNKNNAFKLKTVLLFHETSP